LALLVSLSGEGASRPPAAAAGAVRYRVPLAGPVVVLNAYSAPANPFAAGNRGVDLAAADGATVLAAAAGTVRFAGAVAGRGVVVLAHPDGITTEYEPVAVAVTVGQAVGAGEPLGTVSGSHAGCAPASCLHWGARRGEVYLDPMSLLAPLGVVRLLPWSDP
jgi:murein DD-endopeptidase MepM/ murein hydrolase activator NlpD